MNMTKIFHISNEEQYSTYKSTMNNYPFPFLTQNHTFINNLLNTKAMYQTKQTHFEPLRANRFPIYFCFCIRILFRYRWEQQGTKYFSFSFPSSLHKAAVYC